ncbi:hypothetical protein ACVWWO_002852 [Bradyrhizobium sp. F1.13.1]
MAATDRGVRGRAGASRSAVIPREGGESSIPETVQGYGEAAAYWIPAFAGMTPRVLERPSLAIPHIIPLSSSSACSISVSLTMTSRRGTTKIIVQAQSREIASTAAVSGSVVAEWPPR